MKNQAPNVEGELDVESLDLWATFKAVFNISQKPQYLPNLKSNLEFVMTWRCIQMT